jgi:hypothetical protein
MMQNGFRRIALAQGLLPERQPTRETPDGVETSDAPRHNVADGHGVQPAPWDRSAAMQAAISA